MATLVKSVGRRRRRSLSPGVGRKEAGRRRSASLSSSPPVAHTTRPVVVDNWLLVLPAELLTKIVGYLLPVRQSTLFLRLTYILHATEDYQPNWKRDDGKTLQEKRFRRRVALRLHGAIPLDIRRRQEMFYVTITSERAFSFSALSPPVYCCKCCLLSL